MGSVWKRYGYGWVTLGFFILTLAGHWVFGPGRSWVEWVAGSSAAASWSSFSSPTSGSVVPLMTSSTNA